MALRRSFKLSNRSLRMHPTARRISNTLAMQVYIGGEQLSSIPCRPARGLEKSGGIEIWQAVLKRQPPSRSSCPMMMHRADLPRRESRDSGPRHVTRTSKTFRDTTSPFSLLPTSLPHSLALFLSPFSSSLSFSSQIILEYPISRIFRSYLFPSVCCSKSSFCFLRIRKFVQNYNCTSLLVDFLSYLMWKKKKIFSFLFFISLFLSFLSMFVRKYKEGR